MLFFRDVVYEEILKQKQVFQRSDKKIIRVKKRRTYVAQVGKSHCINSTFEILHLLKVMNVTLR